MKYINQLEFSDIPYVTNCGMEWEEKEKGKATTVRSHGCGPCCAIMVLDRLVPDYVFDLKDAVKLSYDCGANHIGGTDYERFAPKFAEKFGLELEMSNDAERLTYCLRTGGAAVILVKGDRDGYVGVFGHNEHYVAAISEERDGRIAVLDPSYIPGKYEEEGRKGLVEMKNSFIALCDIQVIINDTVLPKPCFYLFWRK